MAIQEGKAAPAFTLPDADGKKVSLKDFKGKKNVVLYFYPKDDTPGCTVEAKGFKASNKKFEAKPSLEPSARATIEQLHKSQPRTVIVINYFSCKSLKLRA